MAQKRKRPHIKFVRGWAGRPVGYIDRGVLDPGVALTLVRAGTAILIDDDDQAEDELPIRKRGRPRKIFTTNDTEE